MDECKLLLKKNYLIATNTHLLKENQINELEYLKLNFCGNVITDINDLKDCKDKIDPNAMFYLTGCIVTSIQPNMINFNMCIIRELSYDYDIFNLEIITIGQVPINIHNVGVYFRNFFNNPFDMFQRVENSHKFQSLTESNKITNAFRKGIYLSDVKNNDSLATVEFQMLRCSTNFEGPTEQFKDIDNYILANLNNIANMYFSNPATINHVLAQIYENTCATTDFTDKKAKIKKHSDKTKDMPHNGLIAFCTFYKNYENNDFLDRKLLGIKKHGFDYLYHETSALTRMRFRLKKDVSEEHNLVNQFDLTLYPNSIFIIPLLTNRLYTHEIVPSVLPVVNIPTRMGYVARCSNVLATHKEGKTYIGENILLPQDDEGVKILKEFYYRENMSSDYIVYPEDLNFSLNDGDYMCPNFST